MSRHEQEPQPQDDPQSFSHVLRALMEDKGCSPEFLASQIPIHKSMVYRWMRGARVPRLSTRHAQRIADVLELTLEERKRLQAANSYSLIQRAKLAGRGASHMEEVSRLVHPPTSVSFSTAPVHLPHAITSYTLPPDPPIISGQEALATAAIAMLHQAAQRRPEGPIYLTFYSPDMALPNDQRWHRWWEQAMREALEQGWDIIHLLPLTSNVAQLVSFVESMRSYLAMPGTYTPYYLKEYGSFSERYGLYSVPTIGTLHLFPVRHPASADAALYLTDPDQISLLRKHVEHFLSSDTGLAFPLALRYSGEPEAADPVYSAVLAANEKPGGRFLIERGLASFTRPASFYDESDPDTRRFMPNLDQAERMKWTGWWFRTQEAIHRMLPENRYRDLCPKTAILNLVRTREYGIESEDLVGDNTVIATPQQVYDHLTNVIRLLQQYRNYELALLDDEEEQRYLSKDTSFWEVYPGQLVLLEYWFPKDRDSRLPRWLDVLMREPTIVHAFSLYADSVWNQIAPVHRSKEYVILWLKDQLRELKAAHPHDIKED